MSNVDNIIHRIIDNYKPKNIIHRMVDNYKPKQTEYEDKKKKRVVRIFKCSEKSILDFFLIGEFVSKRTNRYPPDRHLKG